MKNIGYSNTKDFKIYSNFLYFRELMAGTKWKPMKTSELQKGDIDPHIKMINKSETKDDGKTWGFKIEDAINDDRRAYKCVVYNISEPRNCSESVFFLRVKETQISSE